MLDDIALKLISRTNLNDSQAKVYLASLQLGQAPVSEIAQLAGLKRATTYLILARLKEMGFVNQAPESKKIVYTGIDPNALATELERTSRDFREMLPYLRSMQKKARKPQVTHYTGLTGSQKAMQQIRRPKEARYATSIKEAIRHIPDEVERWKKTYADGKARPGGRHILTQSAADRAYGTAIIRAGQHVRYLSSRKSLDMDFALVDDKVYLTAFDEEIQVTVIESAPLYRSLCTFFDLVWEKTRK